MEKKSQGSDTKKVQIMPADVRAGQIISLVEVTGGLGSVIDASRLADELGANVAVMLPILDTAELLGLVKSEKGNISLTEFGLKFQKTTKNKVRLLTDHLAKIEPFKTAAEMAARYGEVTTSQVARSLAERGIGWHHDPELNESLIRTLLIHWAIYAGLLTYNKNGNFEPARREKRS
jgi:hypothetical protein